MRSRELLLLRENLGWTQAELASQLDYSVRMVQRWESGKVEPRKAVIDAMRAKAAQREPNSRSRKGPGDQFSFIDLFAGIGGMRLGFEAVGGQCVFTSEIDRYSRKTYAANFASAHEPVGDIWQHIGDVPKHDVLLAGFPCQPFSIAGVSKKNALGRPHGFACEAQGTLFFAIARILEEHRPRAFLLENVKNLTSHDHGRTFGVIMDVLENQLGYKVFARVVDARAWVPQHRERIFLVGFRDVDTAFSWDQVRIPKSSPSLGRVLHPEDGTEQAEAPYTEGALARVSSKYNLTTHLWQYLQDYAEKHRAKGNGFGFGLVGPYDVARTLSARYYKDGSEILVARGNGSPRRLTPRECARLMGFDGSDELTGAQRKFKIIVSDTQAYRQFGNAVVVPVVAAIAEAMKPYLSEQLDFAAALQSA